jgi:hypothetical protein
MSPAGKITVNYRIPLGDGNYTSYSLPAVFQPEDPRQVLDELNRRIKAATAQGERMGRPSDPP